MENISELINIIVFAWKHPILKVGTGVGVLYFLYPYVNQIIILLITRDKDNIASDYDFKNKRYTFKKRNKP